MVKYLIRRGADIHASNDSALLVSVLRSRFPVIKYLIEQGADTDIVNEILERDIIKFMYPPETLDYFKSLQ